MSNIRRITKRGLAILAIGWLGTSPLTSAFAATDVSYGDWLDSVKFGGDLRLRHDTQFNTSNGSDRNRDRFRLRYGFTAKASDLTAIFRMSTSGGTAAAAPNTTINGDPLSANQTEDTSFSRKGLWVDLAELRYKPFDILTVEGGKMENPFWNGWSSSIFWDPDLNPEGYAEELNLPLGIFATMAQFSINEASAFHDANPWMFAERIGAKENLPGDMTGTLSVTDYGFTHERNDPFGGDLKFGNQRQTVNGNANVLKSAFNVLQLDSKLALRAGDLPLTFEGSFVRNTQESQNLGRDGQILGVTVGKASKAKTWEVAYFYKRLGANAVISDFVDDDFGYGGTNQGGHIMWVGYAPRDYLLLKAMFYSTHILDTTLSTLAPYTNHMMLDVVLKI